MTRSPRTTSGILFPTPALLLTSQWPKLGSFFSLFPSVKWVEGGKEEIQITSRIFQL